MHEPVTRLYRWSRLMPCAAWITASPSGWPLSSTPSTSHALSMVATVLFSTPARSRSTPPAQHQRPPMQPTMRSITSSGSLPSAITMSQRKRGSVTVSVTLGLLRSVNTVDTSHAFAAAITSAWLISAAGTFMPQR